MPAARFIEAFRNSLSARAVRDESLTPFVEALRLSAGTPASTAADDLDHPLMARLDEALRGAQGDPDLISAVTELAAAGGWFQVYIGEGINAAMADLRT